MRDSLKCMDGHRLIGYASCLSIVGAMSLIPADASAELPTVYTEEQAFCDAVGVERVGEVQNDAARVRRLLKQSFEQIEGGPQTSYTFEGMTLACEAGRTMKRHNAASRATDGARSVMITDGSTLVFSFDTPVSAFGFQVIDFADNGESADLVATTDTGQTIVLLKDFDGRNGEASFVGLMVDEPFTQLTVTTTLANDGFYLDECYHGQVADDQQVAAVGSSGE